MNHNASQDEDLTRLNEYFRQLDSRARRIATALLREFEQEN